METLDLNNILYDRLLDGIPVDSLTYREWSTVGSALHNQGYDFSVFHSWSKNGNNYQDEADCQKQFKDACIKGSKVNGSFIVGLYKRAGGKLDSSCFKEESWVARAEWNYRKQFGEGARITAIYHYKDDKGQYLYTKVRIEGGKIQGKEIRYRTVNFSENTSSKGKPKGVQDVLYKLPEMLQAVKGNDFPVYIVEGEKDVETLLSLKGFPCIAITSGGVSSWRKEHARYFKSRKVIILRDNDNEGLKFAETIKSDLADYAYYTSIINVSSLPKGDVTDYLTKEGGTAQSLKNLIESHISGKTDGGGVFYASWLMEDDKGKVKVNQGLLAEAIARNEGYKIVRRLKDNKCDYYLYRHGCYVLSNRDDVKGMIGEYIPAAIVSDTALNGVYGLLSAKSQDHICSATDMDSDARYLNFKNGLYDIRNRELIPHTSEIITTRQYQVDYDPHKKSRPVFDRYISDLCSDQQGNVDSDKVMILQEFAGLILSNERVYRTKKCLILVSELGNSGKSVFIKLLEFLIGMDNVTSINLKGLIPDNKFLLGRLLQTRIISCADESNAVIEDSSTFKKLTGGDSVPIEAKGEQAFAYTFPGAIVVACNGLPIFTDDKGIHLYERLLIVPCIHSLKEKDRDSELLEKMKKEEAAIIIWALEGLHRLIDNGFKFTESESCQITREEYHKNTDNIYRFILENGYLVTGDYEDKILRSDFDKRYEDWASSQYSDSRWIVKKSNIPKRLAGFGVITTLGNVDSQHHVNIYKGLRKKTAEELEQEQNDSSSWRPAAQGEAPFDSS